MALLNAGSLFFLLACGGGPPGAPGQTPTNPRLLPVPAWNLCDRRETVLMHEAGRRTERASWGVGEEITVDRPTAGRESEYHLFFDDRGLLIGYIGILYEGLDLASQRDYTAWLAKQVPTDFLLPAEVSGRAAGLRSGRLYGVQGERVSTRAITIPKGERQSLYLDSSMLTPYLPLLSPYKPEFLTKIHLHTGVQPRATYGPADSESRDYIARQHFAKGEVAHFGLCGQKENDAAVEAYQRAIAIGLSEPLYQAEAHHRLGLAYRDKGLLPQAAAAIETSLKIRPSIPEVVNHLGKVYALMGDKARAAEAYHTAIGLRPNYADAHFNLAEAIEDTQPRRALTAYENYLAYVENTPGEKVRIETAKKRIEALKKTVK
ncbi:MAG: tetratricopeptide repeat protein [Nitrospirae bacterium]|nr:MAG: tetratricopeptide repeat protein [Nitrospirota bacterium]